MGIIYVTGGAKSGKSRFAEELAMKKEKRIYLATSIPFDNEMKSRVKRHKEQRGNDWTTIEAYRDIEEILQNVENIAETEVILLDCLTNMVTNIMIMEKETDWDNISDEELKIIENDVLQEVEKVISFSKKYSCDVIIVSNEVGMGLVPEYPLGRHFRDIAGIMNQIVAKEATEAYLVVSGIALRLK